tara:strand:- start:207 stop:482 length:276 start_codon:yes stop_codon:yes gene_type:complete
MPDIFLANQNAIAMAEDRFEQHPNGKGQGANIAEPRIFKTRNPIDPGDTLPGFECVECGPGVVRERHSDVFRWESDCNDRAVGCYRPILSY